MKNENEYFYFKLGVPRGPFTKKQFIELAESGRLGPETKCISNDNPSMPAKEFSGTHWAKIQQVIDANEKKKWAKKKQDAAERNAEEFDSRLEKQTSQDLEML